MARLWPWRWPGAGPAERVPSPAGTGALSLRIERDVANAQRLAEWLDGRDEVESVAYAGLSVEPLAPGSWQGVPPVHGQGDTGVAAGRLDDHGFRAGQAHSRGRRWAS